jgi:hypothetical protein
VGKSCGNTIDKTTGGSIQIWESADAEKPPVIMCDKGGLIVLLLFHGAPCPFPSLHNITELLHVNITSRIDCQVRKSLRDAKVMHDPMEKF